MAKIPDGYVFLVDAKQKIEGGRCVVDLNVDGNELIMCKSCEYWRSRSDEPDSECHRGDCTNWAIWTRPDFYCADGRKRHEG